MRFGGRKMHVVSKLRVMNGACWVARILSIPQSCDPVKRIVPPVTPRCIMIAVICLSGCGRSEDGNASSGPPGAGVPETSADQAMRVLGKVPEFELRSQKDEPFGRNELDQMVWVADFIFTRCPSSCPLMTYWMGQLQKQLREDPATVDVQFVSFSVDPEFDTPQVLAAYAKQNNADLSNWSFLTGSREAIWQLCEKGFMLSVGDDPNNTDIPILHSPRFVLVDHQGQIRGYYDSQEQAGRDDLVRDIRRTLAEP